MVMASKEQGQAEFLSSRTREVDGAAQVTQEHKQQLVNGNLEWEKKRTCDSVVRFCFVIPVFKRGIEMAQNSLSACPMI